MPKKKAKKKSARKATPKKKTRPAARKSDAKRSGKARKPARRATPRARPARKHKPAQYPSPVPFAIVPGECSILPPSQHFPPYGTVFFNSAGDCTLVFSNPALLGLPSPDLGLSAGNHKYQIQAAKGSTEFHIQGCPTENGPADITVP